MNGMHADHSGIDPLVVNLTHRAVLGDVPRAERKPTVTV